MLSKMLSKIACFLGHGFRRRFGRVLGGFREAKILDFHVFFDVFSMRNCNGFWIRKNDAQNVSKEGGGLRLNFHQRNEPGPRGGVGEGFILMYMRI